MNELVVHGFHRLARIFVIQQESRIRVKLSKLCRSLLLNTPIIARPLLNF